MSTVDKPTRRHAERWCPPKPRVGLPRLEKVLNRHTAMHCPESRLVVAVIARAIHDCLSPQHAGQRRAARRFVLGPRLVPWCDLVGLEPEFVRFVAQRAGYLADEQAHWQALDQAERHA
ncbi:hypothetical protein U5801_26720 [Lamprobacter modestohalophilus]|uniref:hypothetical protein n=1 Tax=Lamprobacter modestohalophilus TaxID=1064514 RepID=UPI002ADED796|nr:hypothetical protein [Lamprobacter modestohalophilus]MEA1053370.1 hypothetical protein [Lamprobacter modestohalophilus]